MAMLSDRRLRGALLFVFGLFLFACLDATTKYLAERYEVPLIVGIRYIVNWVLLVALTAPSHSRELVETRRTGLVVVRGVALASASLLVALGLQRLPVAELTAINFTAPLLVVVLAGPLLKERVGAAGWTAVLVGFAGVLLIARPGGGLDPIGVLFVLGAVLANAAYQLLSRLLADSERTIALLFYTALIGAIAFGIAIPWYWDGRIPATFDLLLFLSLGVYGGLGHYFFTAACRHIPASILAPITYLQLVWAALLGWAVFGHLPDGLSAAGIAIIVASGLIIAFKARRPVAAPIR